MNSVVEHTCNTAKLFVVVHTCNTAKLQLFIVVHACNTAKPFVVVHTFNTAKLKLCVVVHTCNIAKLQLTWETAALPVCLGTLCVLSGTLRSSTPVQRQKHI